MTSDGRSSGQRIRAGVWTVSDLTDTYEVGKLAVPSDDFSDATFWSISGDGSLPPTPARVSSNADGSKSDDGFMQGQWRINYMTFDMLPVFLTAAGLTSARSADVTIMDYDDLNQPVFLVVKMHRPQLPSGDGQYAVNGWSNVIWKYDTGIVIT